MWVVPCVWRSCLKLKISTESAGNSCSPPGTGAWLVRGARIKASRRLRASATSACRVRSGLRRGDVDHPGDAELVDALAELVAPHLLFHRQYDLAAAGELL